MSTAIESGIIQNSFESYTDEHLNLIAEKPHYLGWICGKDKLIEIHGEWIRYLWDSDENRSLQAHRGSYKTTSILEIGVIRWLLFHPDDRIAIIRKTWGDAAKVVKAIEQLMKLSAVRELFCFAHGSYPEFKTCRDGLLTFSFKSTITPEGSITAHGLDASLTGKHYDKMMFDDFVTLKDRVSRAEREKTKDIIREAATNIIDPGKYIAYIGTPWHKHDAWNLFCIPTPVRFSIHDLDILSEEEIEKKRRFTTPSLFAANYLLKHKSDDKSLFKDAKYARWKFEQSCAAHLDAAYDGDHTNGLTFMAERLEGGIQAIGKTYRGNVKDWFEEIVEYYERYNARCIYIEENADKGYTADKLEAKGLNVIRYYENRNKHIKIETNLYEFWKETYWDEKETDIEYIEQILDYEKGSEPDDCPDSAATLIAEEFFKADRFNNLYKL